MVETGLTGLRHREPEVAHGWSASLIEVVDNDRWHVTDRHSVGKSSPDTSITYIFLLKFVMLMSMLFVMLL
jgi:hypothetical protein